MPGLEGTTLGRYHLLKRLGHGGMSEVYLARDTRDERQVALKIVGSHSGDYLERFQRETRAISQLKHAHILPAFAVGKREPWHYLVMPYMERGTLSTLLQHGSMTLEHADELLAQIASALQFAHDSGMIHRDIKPSNILLRDDHYTYLADFGLAKALEGSNTLTQSGILLGTPEYMAPDLADGPATISSDIYSLGILLYQMVTGSVPFYAETAIAVYFKQIREQPQPPSYYNSALPPSIDAVVLRALEKDPRHRFQSALALAQAFHLARTNPEYLDVAELSMVEQTQTRHDTLDYPTPYEQWHQTWKPTQWRRTQQKLHLPGTSNQLPGARPVRQSRISKAAPGLPPLPMRVARSADPLTPTPLSAVELSQSSLYTTTPAPATARTRRARSRHNHLGNLILFIGLALFIVLPMTLIYYSYRQNQAIIQSTPDNHNLTATQVQHTVNAVPPVITTTPLFADSLASNTNSRWAEDSSTCTFFAGAYHIRIPQATTLRSCPLIRPTVAMDNVALQVNIMLNSGSEAGMFLRANGAQYYLFSINSNGQFSFRRHESNGDFTDILPATYNTSIMTGNLQNTLLVLASHSTFELYINGILVGITHDSAYTSGSFAFAATTSATQTSADASFTNFKIFSLPANLTKSS